MKTKELIKYFYGDLISQPRVKISNLLMKSVNFAVQVMKSYYVLVYQLEIQANMKLSYTLTIWLTRILCLEKILINQKNFG